MSFLSSSSNTFFLTSIGGEIRGRSLVIVLTFCVLQNEKTKHLGQEIRRFAGS